MEPEVYAKIYECEDSFWWYRGTRKIVDALLAEYLLKKTGNKILDVGCGSGGMFRLLKKYGEVFGVDQSEDAVVYARERAIAVAVERGSAEHLPYNNNTFDAVTCFDVLYHKWVKDDALALKEINRVLKSGGMLVIREASYDWLRSQHDELVWTRHRFTRNELRGKLIKAGFFIRKCSYVNFFLFPLALVKRAMEKAVKEKNPLNNMFKCNVVINTFFTFWLYLEAVLIRWLSFPFGLSVICVAKKKQHEFYYSQM